MKLEDLADCMRPAAILALEKKLSYQEATRAFQLTLVKEASRHSKNTVQPWREAALVLRMSVTWAKQIFTGDYETSFRRGSQKLAAEKLAQEQKEARQ